MKKIRALLRKGTEWKEIFHLLPSSSAFFVFFFVAVFTMTTCRFANNYESSVVPMVKGRQVGNIPQDELILRDYARKLSLLLNDRNNRQKLYALFRNSPNVSNAVSLMDIGRAFNLKVTYKHAQKVNVSIPWPEHREQFFKDPNSTLYVAYAPLAEDMDVEKIVAFKDGEPVLLDAWEPPDVPVVVLSFEPIRPKKLSPSESNSNYDYLLESWEPGDTIRIPYFMGFKVNAVNGRYPESWWAWPMEIYIKVYLHGLRSLVIIPYWWENDPFTGSSWVSVYHPRDWYYIIYSDGGLGAPSGDPWSTVYKVEMWEEDSHAYPKPEWGGDDFWGSRSYFNIPSLWDRTSNPNDPRVWGVTLWKDGHASGFFKMYYYFYILFGGGA